MRKLFVSLGAAGAVIAGGAGAYAATQSGSSDAQALTPAFSVFSTAHQASDALPDRTAQSLSQTLANPKEGVVDFDPANSRLILSTGSATIWAVPTHDGYCLVQRYSGLLGIGCHAGTANGLGTISGPDGTLISGLLPDGTTHLTITVNGVAHTTTPVRNGVAILAPAGAKFQATWTDAAGQQHTQTDPSN